MCRWSDSNWWQASAGRNLPALFLFSSYIVHRHLFVTYFYLIMIVMNWLVIAHDAEKTEKLRKTLLLNDSQAVVTVMESGKNAADSMLLPISKADHCVTLLSSSKECTPDVSYIIGYFLGRKIPVYTTFEFFPSGNKISASLKYFKSIDLLTDHIGG